MTHSANKQMSDRIEAAKTALEEIEALANKNGIHRWHEESAGDFTHGGGDMIRHKADYYVNAVWVLKIATMARKAIKQLSAADVVAPAPECEWQTIDWIKITDISDMPQKKTNRYEQYDCLVWIKGGPQHCVWNCEHLCWDDSTGDDHEYDWNEPKYYKLIGSPPSPPKQGNN